ncbi:MAG TPA: SAM-dependent methyltransferase [Ktedonobacterales bacterium]
MPPSPTPLEAIIHERLRAGGALTFAEYMDLALYHPQFGYYTAGAPKVGWSGDFFTSPHLHPLFGVCLARQLAQFWEALKRPSPFVVVEQGAGQGVLFRYLQEAVQKRWPNLARAMVYQGVDILTSGYVAPHVVLSNELIDAFPVHLVEARDGRLLEVFVVEQDGRLAEHLGEPSSPVVADYLDRFKVPWRAFGEGWRAEVNLRALAWMRATAERLRRGGFVLTIDYGDTARRLYTRWRRRGTLLCYFRHSTNEESLLRPGQQDMTAHVNFTALIEEGHHAGLRRIRFTTQREFLLGLGINEEVEALRASQFAAADTARQSDQGQADLLRLYSLRNAVGVLLDPAGLGGFRVLIQRKRR